MRKKTRRKFSDEQKRRAVDDYVTGRKTAEQVATENDVTRNEIYKWRVQLDEKAKGARVDELERQGMSYQEARRMQALEDELNAYKATVAQQAVIIDLLKKLPTPSASQRESEVTGLIEITKRLARAKKPVRP